MAYFNITMGAAFGIIHQGGVIPALLHVGKELGSLTDDLQSSSSSFNIKSVTDV
jgi:hypothetical protein